MVEKIEEQRKKLNNALDNGDSNEVINLSKKLDKLIIRFMKEVDSRKERVRD